MKSAEEWCAEYFPDTERNKILIQAIQSDALEAAAQMFLGDSSAYTGYSVQGRIRALKPKPPEPKHAKCPFCRNGDPFSEETHDGLFSIRCKSCCAKTGAYGREEFAWAAWDKRA